MAKIKISSTELVWVFHQRLEAFDDCPPVSIMRDKDAALAFGARSLRMSIVEVSAEMGDFERDGSS